MPIGMPSNLPSTPRQLLQLTLAAALKAHSCADARNANLSGEAKSGLAGANEKFVLFFASSQSYGGMEKNQHQ